MGKLSGFEFRYGLRIAATGRDAKQAAARVRGKDDVTVDVTVLTPTGAASIPNIANDHWRAALHRDFLKLTSSCKKPDPCPVRREERLYTHVFGTGERG
jgi:hypothetical protein